ncbi:MAG: prefoldin subunit alpha [Candidatus Thermoplasmatota archaeon]|nr:prefoldin subunit alpha [Candidatus Thermoplasmatota archaeon]MCL5730503.1 prefoldin subunit alpha [Candidatus Thermoplasmatota archaeon]
MVEGSERINIDEEIEYSRNLLGSVTSQLERIQLAMAEVIQTIAVLTELPKASSSEGKISIGSGLFVKAQVKDPDTVIFPLGSNVFTEEKRESAIEKLNGNLKDLTASYDSLMLRKKELEGKLNALGTLYNQLIDQESKKQ